jgi:glycosyltransferase involved in cell wall biosynthesis
MHDAIPAFPQQAESFSPASSVPPKVSIVMTAYNSSRVIRPALESLLSQSLANFELIIIDDQSQDDTCAIVESYRDPRLQLIRNAVNQGISRSRNIGLNLARGEYIAMSDHDDISLPTRLEKQVAFLDAHPDFIMAAVNCFEQRGDKRTALPPIPNPAMLHWTLFQICPLAHSGICVRREAMEQAGIRYNPDYAYAEDYHIYHLFGRAGKIAMLSEPLVTYMIHPHNTTHSVLPDMRRNGLAFMTEQFREYLGFVGREDEVELVWSLCNQKIPAKDAETLVHFGKFMVEACQRFIDIKKLDEADSALIRRNTSDTWWAAVRMSAEKTGKPALLAEAGKRRPENICPADSFGLLRSYILALIQWGWRTITR